MAKNRTNVKVFTLRFFLDIIDHGFVKTFFYELFISFNFLHSFKFRFFLLSFHVYELFLNVYES